MRIQGQSVTVELGGTRILDDVDLEAPAGAVTGLLGPNGSGKSTLLRTMFRSVTPAEGRVLADGVDVRSLSSRQAARSIAVMLQDAPAEVDLTVLEIVLLGRVPHRRSFGGDTAEDLAIAVSAMERTGTEDLAHRLLGTLSGGQRQRVMLARALAQQAPVLLLDEPSNHLDIGHQLELMQIVRRQEGTVIAALHDLNLALTSCDHVVVLDAGRLAAAGPPRDVLSPELIGGVFGVHARLLDGETPTLAFRPMHPTARPSHSEETP